MFGQNRPEDQRQTGLKDAYKDYFKVGVALNARNLTPDQQSVVLREFNSITCENEMKPASLHPSENVWNWGAADSIANFCRANGIKMRGHCLVWHNQFAEWMFTDKKGKPVKKEVFYQRLKNHIQTVMRRYADVVYCWDVVNEAISDGGGYGRGGREQDPYRNSRLYQLCGDEFIAKAFEFAREADPNVLLFYNDYNAANPDKRDRIFNMVKKMKDNGVPIDGIGMQGHYNIYGPSVEDVDAAIEKYATVVNHIQFTELDVRISEEMGGQLQFSRHAIEVKPYIRTLHTDQYARLFKLFRKHKDVIDAVTFWNLHDGCSWVGVNNYPLLFDKDLNTKGAYQAVYHFNPELDTVTVKEDFVPSEMNQPGQMYPMVNSQGYARFRIDAPQAKSVMVSLGLGGRGGTVLRKDKDGIWTGTTEGPMDEGFHYYHFTIDGAVVNDPGTNNYFGSCRWESGIEIPAHDRDFYANRKDIAHGTVQEVLYYSMSTGQMQTAMVYLPPSYGKLVKGRQERFPVLYLQHGWGENETSWARQGHAGLIMDNLIADGKCRPFIIVMAYGLTNNVQFGTIGQFTATEFETLLVDELVPFIDANYLTKADKWNRAMAGLSMGGVETKLITLRRPEVFGYYGLMSGGTYMPNDIKDPTQVRLIFESCGSKENPERIQQSVEALNQAGLNAVGYVSDGTAHEFLTWRRSLKEMAPMLFR
ncbi:MAG: endo-1,4-beta-xylanase [Bacteroidaceae bacterium]|nr:endo-1,4-beta-xylanase [Bacteroidaceae bacterium]